VCLCLSVLDLLAVFTRAATPPFFGEVSSCGDCRPFETFSAAALRPGGAVLTAGSDLSLVSVFVCLSQMSVLSCVFRRLLFVTLHTHALSYKLYIHIYIHKYMHACMHAYMHTFVCIHSYALSSNLTSCFSVYLPVSYTQAILWVLELDTFYWSSPLLRNKNQSLIQIHLHVFKLLFPQCIIKFRRDFVSFLL
jgi:hypothetical protein